LNEKAFEDLKMTTINGITFSDDDKSNAIEQKYKNLPVEVKKLKNKAEIKFYEKILQLHHPNVQRIHKIESQNEVYYAVLEKRQNFLDNFLKKASPKLKKTQMFSIVREIIEGVRFLHENNITPINLSPKNISIDQKSGNTVKICNILANEEEIDRVRCFCSI
jgi:serine/threonine protein kinase